MSDTKNTNSDTISLLDIFLVIAKHWKLIFFTSAIAAVGVVIISIISIVLPPEKSFLPNYFTAQVIVRVDDSSGNMNLNTEGASSLGLLVGLSGGSTGPTNTELSQALLKGNKIIDEIADKFDIAQKYNITENIKTSTRSLIRIGFETNYDSATGLLTISFNHIDKVFATELINFALIKLEERFKGLTLERIRTKKDFLQGRLSEVNNLLEDAQDNLIEFQKKHGIFNLDIQSEALFAEITRLSSEILKKELELVETLKTFEKDSPQARSADSQLKQLEKLLNIKKSGFTSFSPDYAPDDMLIPQSDLPGISVIYANLLAEISIQISMKEMLRKQYETAKIEEADNSKTFQIIETAEIPEVKSGPSRAKLCIIVTFAAFFLSIFLAFIKEYLHKVNGDKEESEKLKQIKAYLPFKSKK